MQYGVKRIAIYTNYPIVIDVYICSEYNTGSETLGLMDLIIFQFSFTLVQKGIFAILDMSTSVIMAEHRSCEG